MRAVVVGGGKVGGHLTGHLFDAGHAVTVIEQDDRKARDLAETTRAVVMVGDGTDVATLRSAGIQRADWLIAVTGLDEVNLVACELGSTLGARRTLARLNDPRNRATFTALGIQVVAVTDLIGEVIEREVVTDAPQRHTVPGADDLTLLEVEVPQGTTPRRVGDLALPSGSVLVALVDGERAAVPDPDAMIRAGVRVLAVTTPEAEAAVHEALRGSVER